MSKVGAKPFIFMRTFFDGYEDFFVFFKFSLQIIKLCFGSLEFIICVFLGSLDIGEGLT